MTTAFSFQRRLFAAALHALAVSWSFSALVAAAPADLSRRPFPSVPGAVVSASSGQRLELADQEIDALYHTLQSGSPTDITKDFQGLREPALSSPPTSLSGADAGAENEAAAMTAVEAIEAENAPTGASKAAAPARDEAATPKADQKARQKADRKAAKKAFKAAKAAAGSQAPVQPETKADSKTSGAAKSAKNTPPEPDPEAKAAFDALQPAMRADLEQLGRRMRVQHNAIRNELRDDQETALTDITLLWQAAVERSGAIRYAIEKLSRRDATGKPTGDSFTKRVFQNVIRLGGVAGSMWTGTPAGVLSGSLVEDMLRSDPTASAMSRVTDADMLLLAKEVESLQTQVIESYYSYRQAQDQWNLAREATLKLDGYYQRILSAPAGSETSALKPVLDAMFEGVEQEESNAKQAFISARNSLGLLVGGEALLTLEQAHGQAQPKAAQASPPKPTTPAVAAKKAP